MTHQQKLEVVKQKIIENVILEPMELVKKYVHLFDKLRKQIRIPLRQPLLDYAYGSNNYEKTGVLLKKEQSLIPEAINIHQADENNYGYETVRPTGEEWVFLEEDDLWVGLYTKLPEWLREVGEQRKLERQEIMERKKTE